MDDAIVISPDDEKKILNETMEIYKSGQLSSEAAEILFSDKSDSEKAHELKELAGE